MFDIGAAVPMPPNTPMHADRLTRRDFERPCLLTVGAVFRPLPARRRRVMGHPLGPLRPIFWRTT